ncbi:MAG: DUF1254 domain-containing protein [Lactobacillales bacterium]|jgi:hypothetical protein|nr:DUF1254 domain-containing protein [Lactobacillales bacterium]
MKKYFFKLFYTVLIAGFFGMSFAADAKEVIAPINNGKLTPAYVEQVGAEAYFWAWPMINIMNRYVNFKPLDKPVLLNGVAPVGPINHLSMLTDYIKPEERDVACPNQDVVYGSSILDLSKEPVIIQVPDFKGRFWVYQVVNQRTDSFAQLGKMYDTKPGLYMFAGPNWDGKTPKGITKVFQSDTNIGYVIPRVFMKDTAQDKKDIVAVVNQIDIYPLSEYTGRAKITDWTKLPVLKTSAKTGAGEKQWVVPEKAVEEVAGVLNGVPALAGEEAMYANYMNVIRAVKEDPKLKDAFVRGQNVHRTA